MKIIILLLFFLAQLTWCAIKKDNESILLLEDLAAGPGPSRLKEKTSQPGRETIRFSVEGRDYSGDLYQPVNPPALAKLVLIPGIVEQGKDDPRLVNFAFTLARSRFLVLVPDIPNLRELKVQAADSRVVADAFRHLITDNNLLPQGPAGMGAFSYAAGPMILAALQSPISHEVDFLFSIGGYFDLNQVLTFFTTGYFRMNGKWQYLEPNDYGKWVFISSNLSHLQHKHDRDAFVLMAKRKLHDPAAPVDDLVTDLSATGKTLYAFLSNADPEKAPGLIKNLPEQLLRELSSLNIANKDLSKLKAHVILIHGRNDNIIPYSESLALAKALPPEQAQLFIVKGISHVDIKPGLLDKLRLLKTARAILKQRVKTE